jgi:hypothetical protein
MNYLRILLGLSLIPLCTWLGSCIPIATGNGTIIGLVLGIALSSLFFAYGPGHNKSQLPTSYWLSQRDQDNGGINQQAIENTTLSGREAAQPPLERPDPRR